MKFATTLMLSMALLAAEPAVAANYTPTADIAMQCIKHYLPGTTALGPLKITKVNIDDARRTITVTGNEILGYIPFTAESLAQLKKDFRTALGSRYSKYTVTFLVNDSHNSRSLDDMVLFATTPAGPTGELPFITRVGAPEAPAGLDGANIAMWQSHGWYFEPKLNRWEWQRARVQQTVEDLYTQSYVMPFLMPMLENAGAYVMSPRERDINTVEIIIDNDGGDFASGTYSETANHGTHWSTSDHHGFAYRTEYLCNDQNPFREGTARVAHMSGDIRNISARALWNAEIPTDGTYAIYVSYSPEANATTAARYRINAADGPHDFIVNQRMGAGTWIYLGHFPLSEGTSELPIVELTNAGNDAATTISADAVKIGGGMGNVARIVKEPLDDIDYQYVLSRYPRFTEGARYFLQWAGAPDSVYTPSNNVNDYVDDYRCRGLWVNWLTGGSSMLPGREGLNIPIDLSLAFHTDAGTTLNDSIIGTLGIYCTAGDTLGNGSSRMASRDLTDLLMTEIVNSVRASHEPNWTRRGMWDQSYYEARVPAVPALLLELLSHQNFADMKYGLDPTFRFVVSRAIYKSMLKFIAHRDGRDYVVQPLPIRAFAISHTNANHYRLNWTDRFDALEPTARPTYYIIEERIGNGPFRQIARTDKRQYDVTVTDDNIHSYRIVAGNDGGVSFPSEVLALCHMPGSEARVMIVNGFTRVGAPDWFDSGEIAGFYDVRDHGVPYINDISFIGSQFEFRRDIPWMDDDAAGFGASRADYETQVIAGNTFDFVAIHGEAIRQAGYGFISSSVEAFTEAGTKAPIVDLILGKQKESARGRGAYGTSDKTFPVDLQQRLTDYTAAGGSLFISGAYVATDLWDNPFSSPETLESDQKFAADVLGYKWRVDQASVTGEAYQVPCRFRQFTGGDYEFSNVLNQDCYAVESPDSFYPADDATGTTIMRYSENNLIAGTAMARDNYRTVVIGFPFETIASALQRDSLMKQVLDFLTAR